MKSFNFKSFPFLSCFLSLSISNNVYCAPEKSGGSAVEKVDSKPVAPARKRVAAKRNVAPVKKVSSEAKKEEKKDNAGEQKIKKDDVKETSTASSKKEEVKKSSVTKSERKKEEGKEKNGKEEVKKNVEAKVEEKKVEEEKKVAVKENSEEKKSEEKKTVVNNRRRRAVRNEGQQKKSEIDGEEKKEGEQGKKTERRRRGGSFAKKSEEIKKEENEKEVVSKTESSVGISSTDYFNELDSSVETYSGKSNHTLDVREKLSGEDLDVYEDNFRPYDRNGNQNLKKHDILFKSQLIRRVDLKEKVNLPFFRSNKEITKFFLEGIRDGKLVAFFDPFLSQQMNADLLKEQLLMPRDVETSVDGDAEGTQELFFDAHDVSVFEVISNWIFDKNTSDFSEDPTLIKLIIPADKFSDTTKIQRVVCYIRYADAVKYLKGVPEASWIDDQNEAVELTLGEAFSMGLFDSVITFIGNRDCSNGDVVDKWGSKEGDSSYASRKAADFKYKFEGSLDSI